MFPSFQNCQICCRDDNEAELLLCDNCDKGYHTYCFKVSSNTAWLSISVLNHLGKDLYRLINTWKCIYREICH